MTIKEDLLMGKTITVLVVDDEEAIRRNFKGSLEDLGYEVCLAADGHEGLKVFADKRPDIVLTDLRMPGMDGLRLLAALKERSPDTPVVVVSGTGTIRDAIDAIREGAWDYMLKPVQEDDEFRIVIERVLERAQLLVENRRSRIHLEQLVLERTKELRESEARYRTLLESVTSYVYTVTLRDGRVINTNHMSGCYGVTGFTAEEYAADPDLWYKMVPEEDRPKVLDTAQAVLTADTPLFLEHRICHKDGSIRWVSSTLVPRRRDSQGLLIAYDGLISDITERKKAEETEIRLVAAVESAADDIIITDTLGNIQYVNPEVERSTGFAAGELVGKNTRIFKSGKHDHNFYQDLWNTIKAGQVWQGRFTNRAKDGHDIIQDTRIAPIRDAAGRIVGYVAARRDVTAQVKMEQQLIMAERLEAIGTLASGIAHDFNNILAAVRGFTELAMLETPEGTVSFEDLKAVMVAADRATELVKQILTFCRETKQEETSVQVKLVVKEALKFLRASLPSSIVLQQDLVSEANVLADPTALHRMVVNLCTNAGLAMQQQGGILRVGLHEVDLDASFAALHPGTTPGRFLRLTVADTGCGMSPEVQSHIFEPFFTTRKDRGGTGLGLSVTHGIVTKLKGAITVASEPDKGTTFEIFLPVADQSEKVLDRKTDKSLPGNESILFVDDEEILGFMIQRALSNLGYRVSAFSRSEEALSEFQADPAAFDLLITDLTMPVMTGDVLTQRIVELRPDLPVILCTGYLDRITPESVRSLGVDVVIPKPFTLPELSHAIRKVFDNSDP